MFRSSKSSLFLASAFVLASLTAAASLTAGCGVEEQGSISDETALGRVEMPLVNVAEDGTVYRLRDVRIELSGRGGTHVIEADDDATVFVFDSAPGTFSARLLDGWSLQKSSDGGATFSAVGAVLASLNPMVLSVSPNVSSWLNYEFLLRNATGNVGVTFSARPADGQLTIDFYPNQASGRLAQYRYSKVSMALYFDGSSFTMPTEDGPSLQTNSWTTGLDVYDDHYGVLRDEVAPMMSGYALHFEVAAQADGSQLLKGNFSHNRIPYEPALEIEEGQIYYRLPLDEQGYPVEAVFSAQVPFSLSLGDEEDSAMSGVMNVLYAP